MSLLESFLRYERDDATAVGNRHLFHITIFNDDKFRDILQILTAMEPASLAVNGIDPHHPLRPAIDERDALQRVFREVRQAVREARCSRAVLVGHNAHFDLGFMNEAVARSSIKRNPFHPFSCFDTATACGIGFGQTVLARAVIAAGFEWDESQAHSASYDAEMTAEVFCEVVNRYRDIFENSRRYAPPQP